ncbi:hypothetical protein QMN58_29225, partial [Escherichia coli]|nr:hypothetical protein [Escherichia coli]
DRQQCDIRLEATCCIQLEVTDSVVDLLADIRINIWLALNVFLVSCKCYGAIDVPCVVKPWPRSSV